VAGNPNVYTMRNATAGGTSCTCSPLGSPHRHSPPPSHDMLVKSVYVYPLGGLSGLQSKISSAILVSIRYR